MAKKDSHFIPSPFPAVTEYENTFVREGNKFMAEAVAGVLKYIAQVTASVIKDKEVPVSDDGLEKAHNVGDVHPNGIWVWTEYKSGKFDWRVAKKPKTKKPEIWEMEPEIDKLQTAKECQDYVVKLGYISWASDIYKADLKTAKLVCSALVHLHDLIPYQKIDVSMRKLKDATMDASDGSFIRMNSDYFMNFDPSKYWHRTNDKYVTRNQAALAQTENQIKAILARDPNADVRKLTATRDKLAEKVAKYPRWTYGDEDTLAADIILHEMGHILNAQCTGSCGHWRTQLYKMNHTDEEKQLHIKLNAERDAIFQRYLKETKVISEYSTTKNVEFFAECFVAWLHRDSSLPKYVKDYYDKYFKLTTPKR